jgi:predicted nuclease of predicted toxin-antitoxin system
VKLLIDACMWHGAVRELREAGHDVSWVREWGPDPGDEAILARAAAEGRVLVTLDNDFGELAIARRKPHAGIIRIVEDSVWLHAGLCQRVLDLHASELAHGGVAVVENGRIRVHIPKRA